MTSRNHFFGQGALSQEEIDFLSLRFEVFNGTHQCLNNDRFLLS